MWTTTANTGSRGFEVRVSPLSADETARQLALERDREIRIRAQLYDDGVRNTHLEIARKLLASGDSKEKVAFVCGMSPAEIDRIAASQGD